MARKILKECVYCGSRENLTKEHGPPKLIFPKPRPLNLITVPACLKCNAEGNKDAEFFLQSLMMNPKTRKNPHAPVLKQKVQDSLNRPGGEKHRAAVLRRLKRVGEDLYSFEIDIKRLHVIAERTVRCIYLHETGKRIPTKYSVRAISEDFLKQFSIEEQIVLVRDLQLPLALEPWHDIHEEIFSYKVMYNDDDFNSLWELRFYKAYSIIVLTCPGAMKR